MQTTTYKNYLLTLLMVLLAFNTMDGLVLGLLLQNIKVALALSDSQLGLLTGIAFALFYSVVGIPLARRADSGNRVKLLAVTTVLWGIGVALCGLAANFIQLLSIRVAVAIGEAGCLPVANSLVGETFSRAERPKAVSRFMLGGPLSAFLGYFLAGWLNEYLGWRMTFIVLGLPGLALGALVAITLKEPRSEGPNRIASANAPDLDSSEFSVAPALSLGNVCKSLYAIHTFRTLVLTYCLMALAGSAMTQWLPTYLIRTYQLGTGELGSWFAVVYGLTSALGTYWGGVWAFRCAANDEARQLRAMSLAYVMSGVALVFVYLTSNRYVSFTFIAVSVLIGAVANGPFFALLQTLVPDRMRAQALAITFLVSNLVGTGLGPLTVGALSDAFHSSLGPSSLRYALIALCPSYFGIAAYMWRCSRTVSQDLSEAADQSAPPTRNLMPSNGKTTNG